MKEIVIVTFWDERDLFNLQARTIEKFIEPCIIHIIVNETQPQEFIDYTKDSIKTLQKKHTVHIHKKLEILPNNISDFWRLDQGPGWHTQQMLKLLAPTKGDYISLDGKDLFIKPTTFKELGKRSFKNFVQGQIRDQSEELSYDIGEFYREMIFKCKHKGYTQTVDTDFLRENITPVYMYKDVQTKILQDFTKEEIVNWFTETKIPLEYMLHDYYVQLLNLPMRPVYDVSFMNNIWNIDQFVSEWNLLKIDPKCKLVKIHRRVFNEPKYRKKVLAWFEKNIF